MTAKGCRVTLWDSENVLKLILVIVANIIDH